MKRFSCLLSAWAIALFAFLLTSCEDNSGEYVEQLHTNSELTNAIRSCLTVSKDSTVAHLCTQKGFIYQDEYKMPITAIPDLQKIQDTLTAHNVALSVSDLLYKIDSSCVNMGTPISSQSTVIISDFTCPYPNDLITGGNSAITDYFRTHSNAALATNLSPLLAVQLNTTGASQYWAEITAQYTAITGIAVTANMPNCVLTHLLSAFYTEMAKEEALIRSDSSHRINNILISVFGQ